jgi:hypothetical protein
MDESAAAIKSAKVVLTFYVRSSFEMIIRHASSSADPGFRFPKNITSVLPLSKS